MRPALAIAVSLATLLAALPAEGQARARRPRIAILEVRALGIASEKAQLISEVALTEAAGIAGLEVIGRSDIQAMIGFEKEKQMLGCAEDSQCMAEIAGAMGVDWILVGSLGQLDALYRLDLKLIDARRSRIAGRSGESVEGSQARLVAATQAGVHTLLDPVAAGAGPDAAAAAAPKRDVQRPPAAQAEVAETAHRWSVEARAGITKASVGEVRPVELEPDAFTEIGLGAGYRLGRGLSLQAGLAFFPARSWSTVVSGTDVDLEVSGYAVTVGGAWAPRGNRYVSLAAEVGVAHFAAALSVAGDRVGDDDRNGLLLGLGLRLDYPLGEAWYVGARAGARVALVGFDYSRTFSAGTAAVRNDVTMLPVTVACGYRF